MNCSKLVQIAPMTENIIHHQLPTAETGATPRFPRQRKLKIDRLESERWAVASGETDSSMRAIDCDETALQPLQNTSSVFDELPRECKRQTIEAVIALRDKLTRQEVYSPRLQELPLNVLRNSATKNIHLFRFLQLL